MAHFYCNVKWTIWVVCRLIAVPPPFNKTYNLLADRLLLLVSALCCVSAYLLKCLDNRRQRWAQVAHTFIWLFLRETITCMIFIQLFMLNNNSMLNRSATPNNKRIISHSHSHSSSMLLAPHIETFMVGSSDTFFCFEWMITICGVQLRLIQRTASERERVYRHANNNRNQLCSSLSWWSKSLILVPYSECSDILISVAPICRHRVWRGNPDGDFLLHSIYSVEVWLNRQKLWLWNSAHNCLLNLKWSIIKQPARLTITSIDSSLCFIYNTTTHSLSKSAVLYMDLCLYTHISPGCVNPSLQYRRCGKITCSPSLEYTASVLFIHCSRNERDALLWVDAVERFHRNSVISCAVGLVWLIHRSQH